MAENPFGQGGPEEEELEIEGNPIDTAEVDPQLAEAIASGDITEMEDGSVEVGEFVEGAGERQIRDGVDGIDAAVGGASV